MSSIDPKDHMPSIELLLDYLDGLVSDEVRGRLVQKIADSEELSSTLEGLKIYYESVNHDRERMDAYVESLSTGFEQKRVETQSAPIKTNPYFKIAATLLLIAAISSVFFFGKDSSEDLASLVNKELGAHYAAPSISRSEGDQLSTFWSVVVSDYNSTNFSNAIASLEEIDRIDGEDPTSWFYLGLCHTYKKSPDLEQAIEYLKRVTNSTHMLSDRAKWYLALVYFKLNQTEMAIGFIRELEDKQGFKSKEAIQIASLIDQ